MFSPNFTISNKILKSIGQIEAAKEVIENSPLVPAWVRKFKKEAVERTIHYSTHIEGNRAKLDEVKLILRGKEKEVIVRERDVQEIINYRKVMDEVQKQSEKRKEKIGINEELIKELHSLLTQNILPNDRRGEYRKRKGISRNSVTLQASWTWPDASEILAGIRALLDWVNSRETKDVHPVIKSGIIHSEIVRIHPFDDANGRLARVLATLYLYLEGYDINRFFSLEEYYDSDAMSYYKNLGRALKKNADLTTWLEYFCEGLAIELNSVKSRVLKLSKDVKLRRTVGQIALNERQEQLIEYMQDFGGITNKKWQELFPKISDDTILRDLKGLMDKKIVVKRGKTKSARYELK